MPLIVACAAYQYLKNSMVGKKNKSSFEYFFPVRVVFTYSNNQYRKELNKRSKDQYKNNLESLLTSIACRDGVQLPNLHF